MAERSAFPLPVSRCAPFRLSKTGLPSRDSPKGLCFDPLAAHVLPRAISDMNLHGCRRSALDDYVPSVWNRIASLTSSTVRRARQSLGPSECLSGKNIAHPGIAPGHTPHRHLNLPARSPAPAASACASHRATPPEQPPAQRMTDARTCRSSCDSEPRQSKPRAPATATQPPRPPQSS